MKTPGYATQSDGPIYSSLKDDVLSLCGWDSDDSDLCVKLTKADANHWAGSQLSSMW